MDKRAPGFPFPWAEPESLKIRHWREVVTELHRVFGQSLQRIRRQAAFDSAAAFLWDPEAGVMRAVKTVSGEEVIDGEEELPLTPKSPLRGLMQGGLEWLTLGPPDNAAFVPLKVFSSLLGLIRLSRGRTRRPFTRNEKRFLLQQAHALSLAVWWINSSVQDRLREAQWRTFNEISVLIHQSLRLRKLLEDVAKKVVKNFGFDRVKIFLVDSKKKVLRGELGYTLFEGLTDISKEMYPLKAGENALVNPLSRFPFVLPGRQEESLLGGLHRRILHSVPLQARQETLGVFMVDNLLSQQEISAEEIQLLETLAGQLALAIKNAALYEGVEELSIRDELTKLYLVRYFKERLEQECLRAVRSHIPFALCMVDVDRFKSINDTYGHPMGDRVLQGIAQQLQLVSRKMDVVARYAGDEFIVLLPNTSADQALQFAQRLRQSVYGLAFSMPSPEDPGESQALRVSVSIGVSVYPLHGTQAEQLIQTADAALYLSKRGGRNDVRLFSAGKTILDRSP
jgi:diguanylate cyclase (GGDEF)-like protein